MKKMDYYKLAFSRLHASKPINVEDFEQKKKDKYHVSVVEKIKTHKLNSKRCFSISVVIICAITVGIGILAICSFGNNDMGTSNQTLTAQLSDDTSAFQTNESSSHTQLIDTAHIEDASLEQIDGTSAMQTEIINSEIKFGLKDLLILENPAILPAFEGASSKEIFSYDPISLQGYPTSAEYKAGAEWFSFKEEYDKKQSILNAAGNQPTEPDSKYDLYLTVHTQEMADKLEEISSKYQLNLHTQVTFLSNEAELYDQTEMNKFLGAGNNFSGGYVYNNGTFLVSCIMLLPDGRTIGYQLHNTAKGIFNDAAFLNISDRNEFDEWNYITKDNLSLQMAASSEQSLVIADLEHSFVVINILENMSQSDLIFLADSIYFSEIK